MAHTLYTFMTGIGFQLALMICLAGTAMKLVLFFMRAAKKDKAFLAFFSFRYAGRSILFHLVPYMSRTSRMHPEMTAITIAFHAGVLTLPFFFPPMGCFFRTAACPGFPASPISSQTPLPSPG